MGLDWNYDAFVSLSLGFFVAFICVRMTHELGNGLDQLRQQWRQRREIPLEKRLFPTETRTTQSMLCKGGFQARPSRNRYPRNLSENGSNLP